jgi:hypothetical protein
VKLLKGTRRNMETFSILSEEASGGTDGDILNITGSSFARKHGG